MENRGKPTQDGGNLFNNLQRQLGQENRSDFVYGPFHPAVARKQEHGNRTVQEKERKSIQDWENLASSFRPQYQNPGELQLSIYLYRQTNAVSRTHFALAISPSV